ncbi:MAG: c-type cytochrome [Bacillota bacterium]
MTKTQIWVAAFLGLFLVLFGITYVTREEAPAPPPNMGMATGQTQQANQDISAADLIKSNGCTGCHGPELKGTNLAPALTGVKENWSRDELISYLRNPSSFMDKDRFKAYRQKYNSMMPPFNHLDIKNLGKIADHLMTL